MEDRTGLRQRCSHCSSIQQVTLGKHTYVRHATEATSWINEVPCGNYTYGLTKGSTTYGLLQGRLTRRGITTHGHLAQNKGWPWAYTTVLETGPVWASRRGSWEHKCLFPSKERGLPPRPWWRHETTGTAQREGPCTDMLAFRMQSEETDCVEEGSRHESTCPSDQSLRTNQRDKCIERCVSASTSWTGACKWLSSGCAGPRLVVTHRLSWARWRAEEPRLYLGWRDWLDRVLCE